jgi:hypothetical protein
VARKNGGVSVEPCGWVRQLADFLDFPIGIPLGFVLLFDQAKSKSLPGLRARKWNNSAIFMEFNMQNFLWGNKPFGLDG